MTNTLFYIHAVLQYFSTKRNTSVLTTKTDFWASNKVRHVERLPIEILYKLNKSNLFMYLFNLMSWSEVQCYDQCVFMCVSTVENGELISKHLIGSQLWYNINIPQLNVIKLPTRPGGSNYQTAGPKWPPYIQPAPWCQNNNNVFQPLRLVFKCSLTLTVSKITISCKLEITKQFHENMHCVNALEVQSSKRTQVRSRTLWRWRADRTENMLETNIVIVVEEEEEEGSM